MPDYMLGLDTYACETEDGTIFLELSTRKYFAVDNRQTSVLRQLVKGWPEKSSANNSTIDPAFDITPTIKPLLAAGVLSICNQARNRHVINLQATSSFGRWQSAREPAKLRYLPRFLICLIYVAAIYRLGWLKRLVRDLERINASKPNIGSAQQSAFGSLVNSFVQFRSWFYTAHNKCLFDSLVLSYFVAKVDLPCKLVIGVSSKPFRADAWVQCEGMVVNSYVEDVQVYTPILVA